MDRVRLLEQELQGTLPALAPKGIARVALPIAVNADSLATWFAPAMAAFAADAPVLMEVAVDDQDHTTEWLRSGAVLAAVTGTARPAAGCNSRPLGAMRYLAAASPAFVARHFASGVGAGSLAKAPSLVFNTKDELQARWVRRLCHRHVELPRHTLPSPQAFVTAAVAGMGWGLQPQALIASHLARRLARRTGARYPAGRAAVLAACTRSVGAGRDLESPGSVRGPCRLAARLNRIRSSETVPARMDVGCFPTA